MVVTELFDPSLLVSQAPLYFACGMLYSKMQRINAAVQAVETCPVCQAHRKIEVEL